MIADKSILKIFKNIHHESPAMQSLKIFSVLALSQIPITELVNGTRKQYLG
jgi:hypothetical protein